MPTVSLEALAGDVIVADGYRIDDDKKTGDPWAARLRLETSCEGF